MKRALPFLAWLVASAMAQDAPPAAQPDDEFSPAPPRKDGRAELRPKTESASRQFVIHGSDFVLRGAIATLAEEMRKNLLEEVSEDEKWAHTIVIQLHGHEGEKAPARTMRMQPFWIPGGFRLQLDIHLAKGKPAGLDRALLELLLIERGLRKRDDTSVDGALAIPPWLLEGFLESFRWRDGERNHELYSALFQKNQLFPVKRLLDIEEPGGMDSMTRAAFRASSGALVMSLLSQPGGRKSMREMLGEVATFEGDEMALLTKHFPDMNLSKDSFAKWWALQLARMADAPFTQVLTIRETEAEFERLLVVRFKDPGGGQIELRADQFRNLLALPEAPRKNAVFPVLERCALFQYRAFPAHRPILAEYVKILGEILKDTDNSVEQRLQRLATQRADLVALGNRTRDYLEWFGITTAQQLSGDFESFIELKEELESTPERKGPLSEYLDGMQRILSGD